jgi:hypothetical protein
MTDGKDLALQATLEKIAEEREYRDYNLVISPISSGGANYSSRLYAGTISAPNKTVDLKWFAKVALFSAKFREDVPVESYKIEQYAYTRLMPLFEDIQDKHSFPESDRLSVPVLYGHAEESPKELVVLQDLAAEGFATHDRLTAYDWQYASTAIQQIATFHALSLAVQINHPQEYNTAVKVFKSDEYNIGKLIAKSITLSVEKSLELIREENRERARRYLSDLDSVLPNLYGSCRRPVIAHGDFRMSNILHKIDQVSKSPILMFLFLVYYDSLVLCY